MEVIHTVAPPHPALDQATNDPGGGRGEEGGLQLDCSETLPISQMTGVEEQQMVTGPLGPRSSTLTLTAICRHTSLRFIHSFIRLFLPCMR